MTDATDSSVGRTNRTSTVVLAIIVVLLAAAIAVVLSVFFLRKKDDGGNCIQPEVKELRYNEDGWKQTAAVLTEYMNRSIDPCENFYDFVCDRIQHEPDTHKRRGLFSEADVKISEELHSAIKSSNTRAVELSMALQKGSLIYNTCLENVNATRISGFRKIITDYGGWSAIGDEVKNPDPLALMGSLHADGFETPFIQHGVILNRFAPNETAIFIGEAGRFLTVERGEKLNNGSLFNAVATVLGLVLPKDKLPASVAAFWKEIQEYEGSGSAEPYMRTDPLIRYRMTVKEMKEKYGWFWSGFMTKLSKDFAQPVLDTTTMIVERKALDNLKAVLEDKKLQKFLHNYFILDMVFQLRGTMQNSGHPRPLRDSPKAICANFLQEQLPHVTTRFYVMDTDVRERDINNVGQMTYNLKQAYKGMFKGTEWLTDKSRAAAVEKLDYMSEVIGWPAWVFDNQLLDAYHTRFDITSKTTYVDMVRKALRFHAYSKLKRVGTQFNRRIFDASAAFFNAFNRGASNMITIPAAIFDKPQYSSTFPEAFNYGMIGMVLAHEIGHGFQQSSLLVGPDGKGDDWMDKESKKGFRKTERCLIDQYSKICFEDGRCVNGSNTRNENLADNAGMTATFFAYERYAKEATTSDAPLPGLETFSQEQVLYLAFARLWCQDPKRLIFGDVHSPSPARVLGTLRNSDAFAQAFSCPAGSGMNPAKKCRVWH